MHRSIRVSLLSIATIGALSACGSSSKATTAAPATTAAVATTAAPAATTAAPAATTAAPAAGGATTAAPAAASTSTALACAAAPGAGAQAVSLVEWSIKAPATMKAGKVELNVTNTAGNPHELAIFKADSFDALPKSANGAVDETKLAAGALLGRTEKLSGNKSCGTTVDLKPGKYVFVCNIAFGPNSHAAKGQNTVVEVTA